MNKFISDIIWQVGGSIVNRASFFIALLLLSSTLTYEDYGVFGLIYNLSLSAASIVSVGVGIVTRRELTRDNVANNQHTILISNIILIVVFSVLYSIIVSIYKLHTESINISSIEFISLLFLFSANSSVSYYLNYHYSGLGKFKLYNVLLLPINVILPIIILFAHINKISTSVLLITSVVFIGNLVQTYYIKTPNTKIDFNFQKKNHKYFYPCFLQALLGLPVYVLLQMIILWRWNEIGLIGLITITTQILNMSNIFASKSLTVFSPRITKAANNDGYISLQFIGKMFLMYTLLICVVSFVLWLALPLIIEIFKSNCIEYEEDMRYFILMNIFISLSWFFVEFFHAIKKSWISLSINVAISINIFLIFFVAYYHSTEFSIRDYANCLAFSRIIILLPCLYIAIKCSKRLSK